MGVRVLPVTGHGSNGLFIYGPSPDLLLAVWRRLGPALLKLSVQTIWSLGSLNPQVKMLRVPLWIQAG